MPSLLPKTVLSFLRHCCAVVALLLLAPTVSAQCNPAEGLDFWLAFLPNSSDACGDDLRLTVSGKEEAIVEVTVGNGIWSTVDTMPADSLIDIFIPRSIVTYFSYDTITNTGIHVHTSSLTTLLASNRCYASYDAATIMPTRYLGDRYICHDYGYLNAPLLGILAIEDNTEITFQLPTETLRYDSGQVVHITLNAGEVFTSNTAVRFGGPSHTSIVSLYPSDFGLFNGMEVTSNNKPFAMFQGNQCADIPWNIGGCDHTYEQSVPVEFWGKEFVIPSTGGTYHPTLIQITSSEDNCIVFVGNDTLCQLNAFESMVNDKYQYVLPDSIMLPPDTAWHLRATKPVAVSVFMIGCRYEPITLRGDPSSVFVPPIEQGVDHVRFGVVNTERVDRHYLQIACSTAVRNGMRLDGENIAEHFTTLDDTYSTAQVAVNTGYHELENINGTFIAFFSGYGQQESYAYTSGMAYNNLHSELRVDGVSSRNRPRGFQVCYGDSLTFTLQSDDPLRYSTWLIDDSVVLSNMAIYGHRFLSSGTHTVYLIVNYSVDTMRTDTLCARIIVYGNVYETEHVTICPDESYNWRGHSINIPGYYTDSALAGYICYDHFSLQLNIADLASEELKVQTLCHEQLYRVEAVGDAGYITWIAEPHDPQLAGHEHDSVLLLHPERTTRYRAIVAPNEQSDCSSEVSTTLTPIIPVKATIKINNTSPDYENTTIHAVDATEGSTSRQWWIDSALMAETGKYLAYSVDPTADSVTVTLAAYIGLCGDTTSQTLYIERDIVYMPNVFCPSCDNNNRFGPIGMGIEEGEMYIYNREGLLVYHTNDLTAWWDGTNNGRPCPQSAYVWTMRYRLSNYNGFHTATGTVTLLR